MAPVETDLADHQSGEDALPQWPSRDRGLQAVWNDRVGSQHDNRRRYGEQQARHQTADEIVAQILSKGLAEEFLRMQREQALKRHKDHGEKQQPCAKPCRVYQERQKVMKIQES